MLHSFGIGDDFGQFLGHKLREIGHSLQIFAVIDLFEDDSVELSDRSILRRNVAGLGH